MSRKTLILTEEQLEEIASGINMAYFDQEGIKPDMGDIYSIEVSAEGSDGDNESYSDKITTDDLAAMQCKDWPRDSRSFGKGGNAPANIYEMSKKEWEEKFIFNEANSRLENMQFCGKSYAAAKQQRHRDKVATQKAQSNNPVEREKGKKSLEIMINNRGEDFGKAEQRLGTFERADDIAQANKPEGTKIKSAPKQTGNGKAHSPKKGYLTPITNNY